MSHALSEAWEYSLVVVRKWGVITMGHFNQFDIKGMAVVTTCFP